MWQNQRKNWQHFVDQKMSVIFRIFKKKKNWDAESLLWDQDKVKNVTHGKIARVMSGLLVVFFLVHLAKSNYKESCKRKKLKIH